MKINGDVTLHNGPVFTLAGVITRQNWLFGAMGKFDLATNDWKSASFAFGRQTPWYTLHSFINDGREFGGSIYHRVHNNMELGAQLGWTNNDSNARFGLCSKYHATNDLTFRAKVDNQADVSVAATHTLSPGVNLTLSTRFGLVKSSADNKFGISLEYCPHSGCC